MLLNIILSSSTTNSGTGVSLPGSLGELGSGVSPEPPGSVVPPGLLGSGVSPPVPSGLVVPPQLKSLVVEPLAV